jgi:hypothetical protein
LFIYVNLLRPGNPWRLDPDDAVVRLQQTFPEAIVLPGDQLVRSAQRADQSVDATNPAQRQVVEKLWWDARHSGPAYAFYLPIGTEERIDGVIKRFRADFYSDRTISESLHTRILEFLRSLVPPGSGIAVCEETDDQSTPLPHP